MAQQAYQRDTRAVNKEQGSGFGNLHVHEYELPPTLFPNQLQVEPKAGQQFIQDGRRLFVSRVTELDASEHEQEHVHLGIAKGFGRAYRLEVFEIPQDNAL